MQPEAGHASYVCRSCGFDLWLPLVTLDVSTLGFYNDARFPGRCILALHEHYEDLSDVEGELLTRFVRDVRRAGAAIKTATRADHMNYAVLGNTMPHVHFHLIPRFLATDPVPLRPPWEHPLPVTPLKPEEATRVSRAIVDILLSDSGTVGEGEPQ